MPDERPTAKLSSGTEQADHTISSEEAATIEEQSFVGAPRDATLPNYAVAHTIGLGGMGEVVVARDMRIGRDVAIKRLRSPNPSAGSVARFMREAKIQALLDHPSVVPVHEIGTDSAGQPYFTMKRLSGVTLSKALKSTDRPTLQRLLRTFVDACLAVSFAHERRIVHRDLKPSNIMLGDFGEVYVIDWGVARVIDGTEEAPAAPEGIEPLEGMTEAGTLLGTPGYMAPEQIRSTDVGPPADVYALGATLFEILTGEPLHPRGDLALITTTAGIDGAPRNRRPERAIPPELDALTAAALSPDPEARPTARQLADAVQRYLDGDRDVEHRRTLAARELAAARQALRGDDIARRAEAIHSAGRALALDPESRDAAALITALMLEPPREPPREVLDHLLATEAVIQQRQGRIAARSLIAMLGFLIAAALGGLRDAPLFFCISGWNVLMIAISYAVWRRPVVRSEVWAILVGNSILIALLSRLFGPFIVTPVVTCVMALSMTSYPRLMSHARIVVGFLGAAWLGPVVLELAGLLSPAWEVVGSSVVSTSHVLRVDEIATAALLIGGNVLAIVVIGLFANALARSRREAQRAVEIQAWHLRQLLPAT